MLGLGVHHVSLVVTDLERSIEFYQRLFDLERVERPPFTSKGAWLVCGDAQIHLVLNPRGSFRANPRADPSDWHFSFRTDRFDAVLERLRENGFREEADDDDPRRLVVRRDSVAGYPQLYLLDPDLNIIEVNGSPVEHPPAWRETGVM